MNQDILIHKTHDFVQKHLQDAEGGHDYWHCVRVWKTARHIAKYEAVDTLVVELAALLHDIADAKFHNNDEEIGPATARAFLLSVGAEARVVEAVENIVRHVSFKGGQHQHAYHSAELQVVQDADRLDAIGAIGIARTFNYGGHKGRPLYNPAVPPKIGMSPQEYRQHQAPTINHFYEKLLLLAEGMHTATAQAMAQQRHAFMQQFLSQFYKEWEGEL